MLTVSRRIHVISPTYNKRAPTPPSSYDSCSCTPGVVFSSPLRARFWPRPRFVAAHYWVLYSSHAVDMTSRSGLCSHPHTHPHPHTLMHNPL
jgi:hypothetical protein